LARTLAVVILIAIVQGLTEFLPVSSSGHIVLLESLLGFRKDATYSGVIFEVAVHVGTLGAVILIYREKIAKLLYSVLMLIQAPFKRGNEAPGAAGEDIRYIILIVVGSVPAAVVGLLFSDRIESTFSIPQVAAAFLVATGFFLLLSRRGRGGRSIGTAHALIIGLAQAVAILPGISRSGWTITTALLLGIGYVEAAQFSFILSIPAILGALLLELVKGDMILSVDYILPLVVGCVVSFLSGWLALKFLLRVLREGYLYRFSYYLIPVGIAALAYYLYIQ